MINKVTLIKKLKNLKLLYVEDDKATRVSTLLILEIFFTDIIIATDGLDGLEKFKQNEIDIVITDINMPNINGLEMSQTIKEIDSSVPILIFSAYNEIEFFMNAIKLGIEGYLLKPIDLDQVASVLNKSVDNILLKKENLEYKRCLEKKVEYQVQELRDKDRLLHQHSKMAAMGEMIDIIAHQWKQPLNIISMTTDYASLSSSDNETVALKDVEECRSKVIKQVTHLLDTLDEFRNFLRPNINIKEINIKVLLTSIRLLLNDQLIKNQVELVVVCEDDISMVANENDIKHLFINLINNAIEEMIESGVSKKIVTIRCSKNIDKVEILVEDRGRGIPQNIIDNIFKANFSTKTQSGGTGIGLYMSKQIVEKYDGKISVYNGADGAIFKIEF